MVDFLLAPAEVRVLGSLIEKDITTPEYYPLTFNALLAACNQKSNRNPMVNYAEDAIQLALDTLRNKGLAAQITGGSNRVPKYAHRIGERLNLGRREIAVVCELMLRGPQTTGELRQHGSRFYEFTDTEEVETVLRGLMERQPDPLAVQLPRQPGTREVRYAHLLSGQPVAEATADTPPPAPSQAVSGSPDRLSAVESDVRSLRAEVDQLREEIAQFRRQFE